MVCFSTTITTTIAVAISTGSMGVSHAGIGISEYSVSMHKNTVGASRHREPYSETPWGFPQHGGFHTSYTGRDDDFERSHNLDRSFRIFI